jgi:hypothetical protein
VPAFVGGDFNLIPEDIDCHKPSSWEHDALFHSERRANYRAMLDVGYKDAFRSLHAGKIGHLTFWNYFRQVFKNNVPLAVGRATAPTLSFRRGRIVPCRKSFSNRRGNRAALVARVTQRSSKNFPAKNRRVYLKNSAMLAADAALPG